MYLFVPCPSSLTFNNLSKSPSSNSTNLKFSLILLSVTLFGRTTTFLLTAKEMRIVEGSTECFSAMEMMVGLERRGEPEEPRGE